MNMKIMDQLVYLILKFWNSQEISVWLRKHDNMIN